MIAEQCVIPEARKVEIRKVELGEREPREDEILVQTHYSMISPGTETSVYSALDSDVYSPTGWCTYPWVAGYTAVGRVAKAGKNRWGYQVGDMILAQASHASWNWVHLMEKTTSLIPPGMDLKDACYVTLVEISLTAVQVSTVKKGDPVLVIGLGPVGNFAAQLFREHGAKVAGLDPSPHRRELARKMGIPAVLDAGKGEEHLRAIREALGGEEPRIVVEAVGDAAVGVEAMDYARHGEGEVILLGTPRRERVMDAGKIFRTIHRKGIKVIGAHLYTNPAFPTEGSPYSIFSNKAQMMQWIKEGRVSVKPLLSHVLQPEQLQEAYEGLLNRREEYTGVVLDWTKRQG